MIVLADTNGIYERNQVRQSGIRRMSLFGVYCGVKLGLLLNLQARCAGWGCGFV